MKRGTSYMPFLAALGVIFIFATHCLSAPIMVEKNLFSQDRKPPSGEPAAAPGPANAPGLSAKALQLDGVVIAGDVRKAMLRMKGQVPGREKGKLESPFTIVREGEKIPNTEFQVVKIDRRSVSIEKDGQAFTLNLFSEGKVVPPIPALPPIPTMQPPPAEQGFVPQGEQRVRPNMPPPGLPHPHQEGNEPQAPTIAAHPAFIPPPQGGDQNVAAAPEPPATSESAAPEEGQEEEESMEDANQ